MLGLTSILDNGNSIFEMLWYVKGIKYHSFLSEIRVKEQICISALKTSKPYWYLGETLSLDVMKYEYDLKVRTQ